MAVSLALKRWTLDELHSLPDDGNKYELVHGELFVTPPPSAPHQDIIARLLRVLDRYVEEQRLGWVHTARSVIRRRGSETEPDLFVSHALGPDWATTPTPVLVVEVLSRTTRRRDLNQKREYYLEDVGVPEYWIIDRESQTVTVARLALDDMVVADALQWHPRGATRPLSIDLGQLFG
jgi:Uma2 family endonuclease